MKGCSRDSCSRCYFASGRESMPDRPARAHSHNILAYRISELQTGASDCDGEAPAGKNLLELLQKLVRSSADSAPVLLVLNRRLLGQQEVQDVLLVVTRWYGGSPMGPDRFRVINAVSKLCLSLRSPGPCSFRP